jgi:hypothetical protein
MKRLLVFGVALLAACGGGGGDVTVDRSPRVEYAGAAAADMNRDGLTDLVAAGVTIHADQSRTRHVSVLLQNPTRPGTFGVPRQTVYAADESSLTELEVGDLNGDELPDAVASSLTRSGISVFLNDPASPGALRPSVAYATGAQLGDWPKLAIADLDGDARPDVLKGGETSLFYFPQSGSGLGTFLAARTIGPGYDGAAAGDVDGDAVTDAATFLPAPIGTSSETLLYYRQSPALPGAYAEAARLGIGFAGQTIHVADVDGDDRSDFVVGGFEGTSDYDFYGKVTTFLQTDAGFVRGASLRAGGSAVILRTAVADVDADGQVEIAACGRRVDILRPGAGGALALVRTLAIPETEHFFCYGIRAADLNDDGQPDLFASTGKLFVYFAAPGQPGVFGPAVLVAPLP